MVEFGRHARLKILCPSGRAGSSPARGTRYKRMQYTIEFASDRPDTEGPLYGWLCHPMAFGSPLRVHPSFV